MPNVRLVVLIRIFVIVASLLTAPRALTVAFAQSSPDRGFNTRVAAPAYAAHHPRVLFDMAHNNAASADGLYQPFVDLITSDGYRVAANDREFSKKILINGDILVIANPRGAPGRLDSPAFTESECAAVKEWVNAGGSLLLIISHLPFSAAAESLCKQLNVDVTKGHTFDKSNFNQTSGDETELVFTRDNGLLKDHAITRGRSGSESINRIITFSGTSLKAPADSVPFLMLADTAMDVLPPTAPKPTSPEEALPEHTQVSAAGRAQGIAMEIGKGRLVVLGEAGMLTAQVTPQGFHFGMNVPGYDNRQLALNIMHWLSGLLK
jgi:hypothetical protein